RLNYSSESDFEIELEEGEVGENVSSTLEDFNKAIKIGKYEFTVLPNPNFKRNPEEDYTEMSYLFKKTAHNSVINSLEKGIAVEPVGKQSEILNISYQGENKKKNEDIVNQLIKEFNQDGIRDKQLISQRTEEFVAERSRLLFEELDTVETGLVRFKQEGGIVTIESTAGQLFQKESESEKKRYETETQIELTKAFKQELEKGEAYNLLPANLGIESQGINSLTEEFNEAVFLRQELLISSTGENPSIRHIETKLEDIKSNILSSISSYIAELELSLESIRSRESQ